MRFDVANWYRYKDIRAGGAANFFSAMFSFVDEAMEEGTGVLIHCLAGAHRAGTTGVSVLMYKTGMRKNDAIMVAKRCRPVINPIGGLIELLNLLDAQLRR